MNLPTLLKAMDEHRNALDFERFDTFDRRPEAPGGGTKPLSG